MRYKFEVQLHTGGGEPPYAITLLIATSTVDNWTVHRRFIAWTAEDAGVIGARFLKLYHVEAQVRALADHIATEMVLDEPRVWQEALEKLGNLRKEWKQLAAEQDSHKTNL